MLTCGKLIQTAGAPLDPAALAYKNAHGITLARTKKISLFLRGLEALNLRSNLVDAACYREDTQPSSTLAPSILGVYDVTLVGSPERLWNGIDFNGVDQYGYSEVAAQTGARTLMALQSGMIDSTCAGDSPVISFHSTLTNYNLRSNLSNRNPGCFSYGGGSIRSAAVNGWTGLTPLLNLLSIRDDAQAGATSFSNKRLTPGSYIPPASIPTYNRGSTQGEASHTLNQIRLCVLANATFSTISAHSRAIVSGWLLFNKALSDQEETDVVNLLGRTLFTKYRMTWEGDSIDNDLSEWWNNGKYGNGGNVEFAHIWDGGNTAEICMNTLGRNDENYKGFNDLNLPNDSIPTYAVLGAGTNDFGVDAVSAATIFSRLAACWAYAKARGAIVIARTILPRYDDDQRLGDPAFGPILEKRTALNNLIRAQEGILYDVLWDTDQWIVDNVSIPDGHTVDWNTDIYRDVDANGGLHLVRTRTKGADLLCNYLGEILKSKGLLP